LWREQRERKRKNTRSIEKRSSKKEHTLTTEEHFDASSGENFSLFLFLFLFLARRRRRRKSFGG
jgi:MYXO-CTERM domain-containing protein